jgi:hypothetical protein
VPAVALIDEGHAEGAALARVECQDFDAHALRRRQLVIATGSISAR